MHHRYEKQNIPIELLRALVACIDNGGPTKAADALNLTQSAISAQIKRLQKLLGGPIFINSGAGLQLTERGVIVEDYARRILAMNDQILALNGPNPRARQFQIGMPRWIASVRLAEIIKACRAVAGGEKASFRCDTLTSLARDLRAGYLDVAFLCNVTEAPGPAAAEWWETMYWVKSPGFVLRSGEPIPLVSWSGSMSDKVAIKAFEATDTQYTVAFSSPDLGSRVGAVVAGLGIMLVTERALTPELEIIRGGDLPAPPKVRSGIFMRNRLDGRRVRPLLLAFESAVRPNLLSVVAKPAPAEPKRSRLGRRSA